MLHTFYLKNVFILLEHLEYAKELGILRKKLLAEGMKCDILPLHQMMEEEKPGQKESLWITDNPSWAEKLADLEIPLVVFLHPANNDLEFPGSRFGMEDPEELDGSYFENVYRRFHRIPWDILETDRCYIRETTEADVDSFYRIYNDPSIVQYMESLYPEIEQEKKYVREYIDKVYAFYNFGIWTVLYKPTGEVIGRAGFSYREGYADPELGFIIGVTWQKQGLAGEVCRALLKYGRDELGFDKVQTMVHPKNLPSLSLCDKLGFQKKETVVEGNKTFVRMEYFDFAP